MGVSSPLPRRPREGPGGRDCSKELFPNSCQHMAPRRTRNLQKVRNFVVGFTWLIVRITTISQGKIWSQFDDSKMIESVPISALGQNSRNENHILRSTPDWNLHFPGGQVNRRVQEKLLVFPRIFSMRDEFSASTLQRCSLR